MKPQHFTQKYHQVTMCLIQPLFLLGKPPCFIGFSSVKSLSFSGWISNVAEIPKYPQFCQWKSPDSTIRLIWKSTEIQMFPQFSWLQSAQSPHFPGAKSHFSAVQVAPPRRSACRWPSTQRARPVSWCWAATRPRSPTLMMEVARNMCSYLSKNSVDVYMVVIYILVSFSSVEYWNIV